MWDPTSRRSPRQVVRDGDELVVTGHKSFITNAGDADFYCVLGREDDGYSLVLVPATATGLSRRAPAPDHRPARARGRRARRRAGCRPTTESASRGPGFPLVLATLATFRVSVAGCSGRPGRGGAARSGAACRIRATQFGLPLARTWRRCPAALAASWTEIEMARALTYRAAAAATRDPRAALSLSSMAKVGATEAAGRVARPVRAGDGPVRAGARQRDRAAVPRGAADADLRRGDRGHLRLPRQAAGPKTCRRVTPHDRRCSCHVWPDAHRAQGPGHATGWHGSAP